MLANIGICLSGGGIRATGFHLGVLLWLAKAGQLGSITRLSSVSGGSLAVALVLAVSENRWPSDNAYINEVLPAAAKLLTTRSLQTRFALSLLMRPWRWGIGRATLLGHALRRDWGVTGTLKDLPEKPDWIINATCYETGKNWKFTRTRIGDYLYGHNYEQNIAVADAVASSAGLPYLIGMYSMRVDQDGWHRVNRATEEPIEQISPPSKRVRLWDAGVYENLGIEPLYKPGTGFVHKEIEALIVSDASARLGMDHSRATGAFMARWPFIRTPRLIDITTDQIRALRSRMIVEAATRNDNAIPISLVKLGNEIEYIDRMSGSADKEHDYKQYISKQETLYLAGYPTHIRKLSREEFRLLLRHGYEVAGATLSGYMPMLFRHRGPAFGELGLEISGQ